MTTRKELKDLLLLLLEKVEKLEEKTEESPEKIKTFSLSELELDKPYVLYRDGRDDQYNVGKEFMLIRHGLSLRLVDLDESSWMNAEHSVFTTSEFIERPEK